MLISEEENKVKIILLPGDDPKEAFLMLSDPDFLEISAGKEVKLVAYLIEPSEKEKREYEAIGFEVRNLKEIL